LVVLLFALLVLRAFHVASASRSSFGSLLIVGIAGLIFYHASVNMAMTMGLFPVTGLPLPFVSYGGSFLLTMMAGLGQMANVAVHRHHYH
jgi:rod shape determining protein RodA